MALVSAAAGFAFCYGAATVERHRAAAAADAVALTVALHAVEGSETACRDGAMLGRLDGATITRCEVLGPIAEVAVAVPLPGPLVALGPATARAKAGPASAGVSPSTR